MVVEVELTDDANRSDLTSCNSAFTVHCFCFLSVPWNVLSYYYFIWFL